MELIILGATGSIGLQTVEVCLQNNIEVKAIAAGSNITVAIEIIKKLNIECISIKNEADKAVLESMFPNLKVLVNGIEEILRTYKGDVLNAISGIDGLIPSYMTLVNSKNLYLANKETLVAAGELIIKLAKSKELKIIPIDSEHHAIYTLLKGVKKTEVSEIILTASGGAFLDYSKEQLEKVSLSEATHHPNWNMGKSITIQSSLMANKGLEVIEAHYLFNISYDRIKTIIHKESIIHSMVRLNDNSVTALMYSPSMVIPIQNALLDKFSKSSVDLFKFNSLTFKEMDFNRFPLLELAYVVGVKGGVYPCLYNALIEACVELFLDQKISYLDIEKIVIKEVNSFKSNIELSSVYDIVEFSSNIKGKIKEVYS